MRVLIFVALMALAGCATAPKNTRNACAIFEQRDGLFNNWQRAARHAEKQYGVSVPILMATIQTESNFRPHAKPPRTKLLGFIPWKRVSSAYGYSQALDGTWDEYRASTGRWMAKRSNFSDAIHFVGWYHARNHRKNGIGLNDAYNLYLAYYSGDAGYARGSWRGNAGLQATARRSAALASSYASQLRNCD
ncbi:hypothetical protein C8J31_101908 [Rhizobium sp. PP-CC-2G-626]|nr:hypothetical protein C8J31_101908 [Rhizobium sp. PP-CC-2G-626]